MQDEIKNCQNCKANFTIEAEDFDFYEKMKVPPPTWCVECRMIRRMLIRNERSLYRRECDLCGKTGISMYSKESPRVNYCLECYPSDKWDTMSYGKEYDFSKPFFIQLKELLEKVPQRSLFQDFISNSEFSNYAVHAKNSYMCSGGHHYEDTAYCAQNFNLKSCLDVDFSSNSEECVESMHLRKCSKIRFGYYSEDCFDSWLIYGCRNCSNCFGCTNLRNKSYCIWNEQYTKSEYEQKLKEMNLGDGKTLEEAKKKFFEHSLAYPRKFASVRNIVDSTGDDLERVKNCKYCFSLTEDENIKYSFFVPTGGKDCYDIEHTGLGSSECYELHSAFGSSKVFFSNRVYYSLNAQYSDDCYNSNDLFGCVSLRKKSYCILNKEYSKEEYEALIPKIIKHMDEMPYVDAKGRIWKYGEFLPIDLMPFGYNETCAQEYFPLSKQEILGKGYLYKEDEVKNHKATMMPDQLPSIETVADSILQEVIQCAHAGNCNDKCTTAFRLIPSELMMLKSLGVPLPHLCANCRHAERLSRITPLKLWHRGCTCTITGHGHEASCPEEFETPYAPERPEQVFCESCYQKEVL